MERDGDAEERSPAVLPARARQGVRGRQPARSRARTRTAGDQVLYVGDHIYGDILRSKKESAWRTAMIIQELEGEVSAHESCREDFARGAELAEDAGAAGGRASLLPAALQGADAAARPHARKGRGRGARTRRASASRAKRGIERVRGGLREVDAEMRRSRRRASHRFHPFWGSLLKEENEQSSFGAQVEEYACVYTSRVSNFLFYSPQQYVPQSPRRDGPRTRVIASGARPRAWRLRAPGGT